MDGISSAASVVALLAFASGVLKQGYLLYHSAREYRKELKNITDEVAQLVGVLHALSPTFRDRHDGEVTAMSLQVQVGEVQSEIQMSSEMKTEVRLCGQTLEDIQTTLSRYTPKPVHRLTNAVRQLHWSFKKSDILQLRKRLERHKTAFTLILTAQGRYVLDKIGLTVLEIYSLKRSTLHRRKEC